MFETSTHHGPGALRLEGEHAHHGLVVVADVGAHARTETGGNPPQSEQAKNVVDADTPSVAQSSPYHVAERLICQIGENIGAHRRLPPLLSSLVESVRRRPDGNAVSKEFPEHPRICPGTGNAHGHIANEPQRHPGVATGRLGCRKLLVSDPLQPHEKVDAFLVGSHEL